MSGERSGRRYRSLIRRNQPERPPVQLLARIKITGGKTAGATGRG